MAEGATNLVFRYNLRARTRTLDKRSQVRLLKYLPAVDLCEELIALGRHLSEVAPVVLLEEI